MVKITVEHSDSFRVVMDTEFKGDHTYETGRIEKGFYPFSLDARWTDGVLRGVWVNGRMVNDFADHTDRKHVAFYNRKAEDVRRDLERLNVILPGMVFDLFASDAVTAYLAGRATLDQVIVGQRPKTDVPA